MFIGLCLHLLNREEIKNLLGVIISSGVEKMILTNETMLSSAIIGRFVI